MNKLTLILILLQGLISPVASQEISSPDEISVEKFAQLPVMQNARLSPDGEWLAYTRPVKGRAHIVVQNLNGQGQPLLVPPTTDSDFEWLHWANSNRLVFSVSAMRTRGRGTIETLETRLWAIDADGKNAKHIILPSTATRTGTSVPRDLIPAQLQGDVIHWLPDEANHILVSLDGDHDGSYEVRKVDVRDGKFDEIRKDYDGIQNWLTDQSGNLRLGWGYRNSVFKILSRKADGSWESAEKATWRDAGYFPRGFTESSDVAYMFGADESGFSVVNTINVETGEILESIFRKDGIDAGSLRLDPVTRKPVGVTYTKHLPHVEYFDAALASLQQVIDETLPGKSNSIVSITADRRKVLIRSESDIDAGTYLFFDRDENTLSMIARAMPGLPEELLSPVEASSYQARDDLTIPVYMTYPRGLPPENLKTIVMPHGGPAGRDDKSFWFLSQFLASRGYLVMQPNFRGSTGYGRPFMRAGRKEWGGKMQEDVTDGTNWLIEQGIADAEKICIVGWSYGGYSAAMGAVQTPDLFQCAASINGVLDLPRLIADDKKYVGGSVWTRHMGLEDENAKTVSPYHQAEHIQIPMLIIQAKDDSRVHEDQGKRMSKRLKKLKKPFEYVEVDLGGHSMTNEPARQVILRSLENFLEANLDES